MNNEEYVNKYKNIFVSFSGGRTSAFMTKHILEKYSDTHNIKVVFANTGQEHEETYKFIDACDKAFNFNVVWIESVVYHGQRKSNGWKIVDFETATRDGSLFDAMISKYGMPNQGAPLCTTGLKTNPLHNYIKDMGWKKGDYITAIGIRADEIDRINVETYRKNHYWYPLADMGVKKPEILEFFKQYDFDLAIPEYLGNCTWCWKKTLRKHMTLIEECPEIYDVPRRLEEKYKVFYRGVGTKKVTKFENQKFFRGNKSTQDLFDLHAKGEFDLWVDEHFNDCKESCEAMGTVSSEKYMEELENEDV